MDSGGRTCLKLLLMRRGHDCTLGGLKSKDRAE
jgi:hypothetical protein